jgi:hypothetical protein
MSETPKLLASRLLKLGMVFKPAGELRTAGVDV